MEKGSQETVYREREELEETEKDGEEGICGVEWTQFLKK